MDFQIGKSMFKGTTNHYSHITDKGLKRQHMQGFYKHRLCKTLHYTLPGKVRFLRNPHLYEVRALFGSGVLMVCSGVSMEFKIDQADGEHASDL